MPKRVFLNVSLEKELREKFKIRADKDKTTMSNKVAEMIKEYVETEDDEFYSNNTTVSKIDEFVDIAVDILTSNYEINDKFEMNKYKEQLKEAGVAPNWFNEVKKRLRKAGNIKGINRKYYIRNK
ncbi:MAG: hypothetical protein LBR15_08175 [Methanobrevibacter sp.]|nr:hypothetical protein [Candidatus Methanovirga australis]